MRGNGGKSLHCGFLGKEWASRLGRVRIGDWIISVDSGAYDRGDLYLSDIWP